MEVRIGPRPEELTSTFAAELLGVSHPTLMKWARAGEIGSFAVGSHTRFRREKVRRVRALRSQQRAAAHESLRDFDAEYEEKFVD